jgi:hypothetical protein
MQRSGNCRSGELTDAVCLLYWVVDTTPGAMQELYRQTGCTAQHISQPSLAILSTRGHTHMLVCSILHGCTQAVREQSAAFGVLLCCSCWTTCAAASQYNGQHTSTVSNATIGTHHLGGVLRLTEDLICPLQKPVNACCCCAVLAEAQGVHSPLSQREGCFCSVMADSTHAAR